MAEFRLKIVSPERVEFDEDVESLVAPGEDGYLGVLANHAPLLTTLGDGDVTTRGRGRTRFFRIEGGGFLEVQNNQAVMLAQRVEHT